MPSEDKGSNVPPSGEDGEERGAGESMKRIKGLQEYVRSKGYREELGLPKEQVETYKLLAQGEYNINYYFVHPVTGEKLLLRVNCGSQMHLTDQIGYEFHALKLLETSGRTPRGIYVDGSKKLLDQGVMVMEYLPGRVLDYHRDLFLAAECLADIHSVKIPDTEEVLIRPGNPLKAILNECEEMFGVYEASPLADEEKKRYIKKLLANGWRKVENMNMDALYCCCINTELNSTNFLVDEEGNNTYLIDWEKPLWGDPAQDLGHFLAPTTTFWKTDVILTAEEIEQFLDDYIRACAGRFPTAGLKERTYAYIPITCLRGITWCAMAWIQYQQPDKLIFNASTFQKLGEYLDMGFLERTGELLI